MRLELSKCHSPQASQPYSDCLVSMATATSLLPHPSVVVEHLQALEYLTTECRGRDSSCWPHKRKRPEALDFQMEMRSQSRCQMSLCDMSQVLGICHTCIPHTGEETGPPARPAGPTGTRLRLRGLRDHRCPHGVGKGCARTALQQLFLLF